MLPSLKMMSANNIVCGPFNWDLNAGLLELQVLSVLFTCDNIERPETH